MIDGLECVFDHVHLLCSDVATTEKWLVDCFGAEVVRRREVKGAKAADLSIGGVSIFLRGQQSGENLAPPGPTRVGTDHMGLRVRNLDALADKLRGLGVEFEVEPFQAGPALRAAFVRGPDRVRIELVQRD